MIQAQSINPSTNNEYCPDTEITFTVTIPGTYQSIIGVGGSAVTLSPYNFTSSGGNTTFNFRGKFSDVNKAQSFDVTYTSGGTTQHFNEPFKKIKSLFYGTCTPIQPNQTTVTAARCQIVNIPISFNNVQWKTEFESPQLCFGSITTYEYLLPAGWILNGTTSNGSTWIAGDNNESVTSDLSTSGSIQVRAVNPCGATFTKGSAVGISISRPAPVLSITGQDYLCNAGDQTTLTLNGIPTGATLAWSVSLPGQLQPVGCTTCPSVTLEKIGSASTTATLTATVTHCSFTYIVTKTIKLGAPAGIGIVSYDNLNSCPDEGYFQVLSAQQPSVYDYSGSLTIATTGAANTISWALAPGASLNGWTWTASGGTVTVSTKQDYSSLRLRVTATNDCGSVYKDYHFRSTECLILSRMASPQYTLHPNPTKGVFAITLKGSDKETVITEIVVKNKVGVTVKQFKYKSGQKAQTVNIQDLPSDVYFVHIFDGTTWVGERIIKE